MRLTSLLNPWKINHGLQSLVRSFRRQPLQEPRPQRPEREAFLQRCLGQEAFLQRCLDSQPLVDVFLDTRESLKRLDLDLGTLVSDDERRLVDEMARRSNALRGPIVEIGTLYGFTTTRMAVQKRPDKKLITVDNYSWNPWGLPRETHRALTCRFLAYLLETGQVESLDMDKGAFYASYKGERPSLVFLDAIHTYEETRADIEWARRIGAQIIAGHDYGPGFPGVIQAVEEAGGRQVIGGSVWVLPGPHWEKSGGALAKVA